MRFLVQKLRQRRIWRRLWHERLCEPLHLNLMSLFVLAFGSFRRKVAYDLVPKLPYAYGLLAAAQAASGQGFKTITAVEFGVARGEGLLNLQALAEKVTRETGVGIKIHGFDTGAGMPPPEDYRDHPSVYGSGDFPMDQDLLKAHLGPQTRLITGNISDTVGPFLDELSADEPIGFVSVDLDFYSSTKAALQLLLGPPEKYTALPIVYFDDIVYDFHNNWCGELLAIREFNRENALRKLEAPRFFEHGRLFRRSPWVRQIFHLYAFDSPSWNEARGRRTLDNSYLD